MLKELKPLLYIIAILSLSSCASMKDLSTLQKGEAASILKANFTIDGKQDNTFSNSCFVYYKDENGKNLARREDTKTGYNLIKSKAGKVYISDIQCMSNKVFYNKIRTYPIENLYFVAKEGYMNYPGDLEIEWASEKFKVLDVLASGGGFSKDKGQVLIKAIDRKNNAQNYVRSKIEGVNLPWNKAEFSDHELLVK